MIHLAIACSLIGFMVGATFTVTVVFVRDVIDGLVKQVKRHDEEIKSLQAEREVVN